MYCVLFNDFKQYIETSKNRHDYSSLKAENFLNTKTFKCSPKPIISVVKRNQKVQVKIPNGDKKRCIGENTFWEYVTAK